MLQLLLLLLLIFYFILLVRDQMQYMLFLSYSNFEQLLIHKEIFRSNHNFFITTYVKQNTVYIVRVIFKNFKSL